MSQDPATIETNEDETPGAAERRFLHDLNNPLAIAAGLVEMLIDDEHASGNLTDIQKKRLERAMKALERIKDLIAQRRNEIIAMQEALEKTQKPDP